MPSAPGERQTGGKTPVSRAEPRRERGEGGCSSARRAAGRLSLDGELWPVLVQFLRGTLEPQTRQNFPALDRPPVPPPFLPRHPPAPCACGRAAPQPSLRFSDSGNGPAAAGEGAARAAPVTGNASARAGPPLSRGAAFLPLRAPERPSGCVSALCCRLRLVFPTSSLPPPGKKWPPRAVRVPRRWEEGGQDPGLRANPWGICQDEAELGGLGERGFAGLNGSATPPVRTSESTVSRAHTVVLNNWKVSATQNRETKAASCTRGQSAKLAGKATVEEFTS